MNKEQDKKGRISKPQGLIKFYWYKYRSIRWKPKIREGASLIYVNKYAYLYGGRSFEIMKDLSRLDPRTGNWIRMNYLEGAAEFGRFGHCCVMYRKSKMVIFGGEKQFNV